MLMMLYDILTLTPMNHTLPWLMNHTYTMISYMTTTMVNEFNTYVNDVI